MPQTVSRVASDSAIIPSISPINNLTIPTQSFSAPSSPGRRRQPPRSPVARALIATFGPTTLRSVLPRRQSSLAQPQSQRVRNRHISSTASSVSSFSTNTNSSLASTAEGTAEPASPVLAHAGHTPLSTTPLDAHFSINAPLLIQKPAFSPGLAPLPSPCSQFSGETYARSPCLSHFALGNSSKTRHRPRPSVTSIFGQDDCGASAIGTEASHSPSSLRSHTDMFGRSKPESPVFATARIATFRASRATFLRIAEHRPISLDMSAATRKPRSDRQSSMTRSPVSPKFATGAVTPKHTPPVSPLGQEIVASQTDASILEVGGEGRSQGSHTLECSLDCPLSPCLYRQ
jgi:hypothetical protein